MAETAVEDVNNDSYLFERNNLEEQKEALLNALLETQKIVHTYACQRFAEEDECWPACTLARQAITAATHS